MYVVEQQVVPAYAVQLWRFSLPALRAYAKALGVPVGRSKANVIENLVASGKATMCASLGN